MKNALNEICSVASSLWTGFVHNIVNRTATGSAIVLQRYSCQLIWMIDALSLYHHLFKQVKKRKMTWNILQSCASFALLFFSSVIAWNFSTTPGCVLFYGIKANSTAPPSQLKKNEQNKTKRNSKSFMQWIDARSKLMCASCCEQIASRGCGCVNSFAYCMRNDCAIQSYAFRLRIPSAIVIIVIIMVPSSDDKTIEINFFNKFQLCVVANAQNLHRMVHSSLCAARWCIHISKITISFSSQLSDFHKDQPNWFAKIQSNGNSFYYSGISNSIDRALFSVQLDCIQLKRFNEFMSL